MFNEKLSNADPNDKNTIYEKVHLNDACLKIYYQLEKLTGVKIWIMINSKSSLSLFNAVGMFPVHACNIPILFSTVLSYVIITQL